MLKKYRNSAMLLSEAHLKSIKGGAVQHSGGGQYFCDKYFPCPSTCEDPQGGPAYECRDYLCVYVFCPINP